MQVGAHEGASRRWAAALAIALCVVLVDQGTKVWATWALTTRLDDLSSWAGRLGRMYSPLEFTGPDGRVYTYNYGPKAEHVLAGHLAIHYGESDALGEDHPAAARAGWALAGLLGGLLLLAAAGGARAAGPWGLMAGGWLSTCVSYASQIFDIQWLQLRAVAGFDLQTSLGLLAMAAGGLWLAGRLLGGWRRQPGAGSARSSGLSFRGWTMRLCHLPKLFAAALLLAVSLPAPAHADGLDRDGILTEAPAVPTTGTVRVTGSSAAESALSAASASQANVGGSVLWVPVQGFAADLGLSYQGGMAGPTARARYQLLDQSTAGFDLTVGARYKSVGFTPASGEAELLLLTGKQLGRLELALNAVYGHETGGPGQDLEAKGLVGYLVLPEVRLGADARVQAEFADENGLKTPQSQDIDFTAGPTVSWMVTPELQIQALAGLGKPKGTTLMGPTAMGVVTFDF